MDFDYIMLFKFVMLTFFFQHLFHNIFLLAGVILIVVSTKLILTWQRKINGWGQNKKCKM